MPTELINRLTIVLPEDTAESDAQRLADALNTHGVAGVLRQLDAVARLMQGLQEPAPPLRPPRTDNETRRCGQTTRTGKTCRRHLPCFWHQPADEALAVVSVEAADTPVASPDAELRPNRRRASPKGLRGKSQRYAPSAAPRPAASARRGHGVEMPALRMARGTAPAGGGMMTNWTLPAADIAAPVPVDQATGSRQRRKPSAG